MKNIKCSILFFIFLVAVTSNIYAKVSYEAKFKLPNLAPKTKEEKAEVIIDNFKHDIAQDPSNYANYIRLAFIYDYIGDYQNELETLKKAEKYLENSGAKKDVFYGNLGHVYLRLGKLEQARQALDKAFKFNPDNIYNLKKLAIYYLEKDQFGKSAKTIKKVQQLSASDKLYYLFYQRVYRNLDLGHNKLINLFRELVRIDSGSFDAHRTYANALRDDFDNITENFPLIMREYKKANKLNPSEIFTYFNAANACVIMGEDTGNKIYYQQALDWLRRAEEIDSEHPKLAFSFGYCYLYMENYEQAINYLEQARNKGITDEILVWQLATAYNNKAYSIYQSGENFKQGLELANKALELRPDVAIFLGTKAELLYGLGRYQQAYDYIKKAVAAEPNNKEMQQDLANIEKALEKKGIQLQN